MARDIHCLGADLTAHSSPFCRCFGAVVLAFMLQQQVSTIQKLFTRCFTLVGGFKPQLSSYTVIRVLPLDPLTNLGEPPSMYPKVSSYQTSKKPSAYRHIFPQHKKCDSRVLASKRNRIRMHPGLTGLTLLKQPTTPYYI